MRSILISFLFTWTFAASAQSTPAESLKAAVAQLTAIGQMPDLSQRVSGLCSLANQYVDLPVLAQDLLGPSFGSTARDSAGVANFNALVPSIMVSDFYQLVNSEAGAKYWVDTTIALPKGSNRVGYKTYFGNTALVITMSKITLKIVDAEWNNISLVKKKRDEYQKIMQEALNRDPNALPVTTLVNQILASGNVVRCN